MRFTVMMIMVRIQIHLDAVLVHLEIKGCIRNKSRQNLSTKPS